MKKVGIMSMQRIYNYGSFLQGYALKKLIENLDSEIQVSFVDYIAGEPLISPQSIKKNGLMRNITKLKEYNNVNSSLKNKIIFFNHKRTYAKRFFPLLGITDEKNNNTNLDVLVIGSDEVFNCVQSNINVGYSRDLFGHNSNAKKIISYAGSFGNTTLSKIKNHNIFDNLSNDFSEFDAVSVRDSNSYQIVKELGVKDPVLNVDPAIAYDYMNLEKSIPKNRLYKEKYIIVYGYSGRLNLEENKILKEYAKKRKLKILCFGGVQSCCDEFIDCNPFELLAYFRDAEAIITDTFHGTIFSIINNKQFGTIIRKSINNTYGNEEKLGFLLDFYGLSNQKIIDNIDLIDEILENDIDYLTVNKKLQIERENSYEFLKKNII